MDRWWEKAWVEGHGYVQRGGWHARKCGEGRYRAAAGTVGPVPTQGAQLQSSQARAARRGERAAQWLLLCVDAHRISGSSRYSE